MGWGPHPIRRLFLSEGEGTQGCGCTEGSPCGDREKAAVSKPRRDAPGEAKGVNPLTLAVCPPERKQWNPVVETTTWGSLWRWPQQANIDQNTLVVLSHTRWGYIPLSTGVSGAECGAGGAECSGLGSAPGSAPSWGGTSLSPVWALASPVARWADEVTVRPFQPVRS